MADQASPISELPKYLQQEQVAEEFRDLVHTLPIQRGWVAVNLHQYQGFWYSTRLVQGALACQNHFQANDSDVILVTTPKSGTTWLKSLMFSLLNRSLFPDPENRHPLLTTNPHVLVPFLEIDLYVDGRRPNLPEASSPENPRLFSTHLPYGSLPDSVKNSKCKLVYLCRNPKDTFVSLWHFANRLRPESWGENSLGDSLEKFCRGVSLYGPFWDHCLGYWNRSFEIPEKVLFLSFDEMKRETGFHVKRLAEFMGCPFSEEEEAKGEIQKIIKLCSFENLSNLEVNKSGKLPAGEENKAFFRQGSVGDWVNHMSPEMARKLDDVIEEKILGSGLKF